MVVTLPKILQSVQFNEDGYMLDPHSWSIEIAEGIAFREGIELTERHWVVINFAREVFESEGQAPTLRRITQDTDIKTKEFYSLFPGGPGKMACMIAGLEKPTGCI